MASHARSPRATHLGSDGGEQLVLDKPSGIAVLPDGVHFVVGLGNCQFRLYHVDGTLVHTFKGHTDSFVSAVAVTPDGQHIISGSWDKLVKVWSVASKSLVSTCAGHAGDVYAVAAMPDGQRILSGGSDNTVRVWLLDGTLENTFELHIAMVRALVALPDNQHALSGSDDNTVKLFNVNDGAVLRTFKHHRDWVFCLALLPDGRRFVCGSVERTNLVEHGLAPLKLDAGLQLRAHDRRRVVHERGQLRRPERQLGVARDAAAYSSTSEYAAFHY